ncbi:hypothetical protein MARINOS108_11420 [Marinoscillum sp. 108]|nr:hypothetical protein MARINOS108_11420 [Marinoscillum sp. 108]
MMCKPCQQAIDTICGVRQYSLINIMGVNPQIKGTLIYYLLTDILPWVFLEGTGPKLIDAMNQ